MDSTAERYANEPVRYPALHVVDLAAEGAAVTEQYRNMVINRVNDSCLRLAVFDGAPGKARPSGGGCATK